MKKLTLRGWLLRKQMELLQLYSGKSVQKLSMKGIVKVVLSIWSVKTVDKFYQKGNNNQTSATPFGRFAGFRKHFKNTLQKQKKQVDYSPIIPTSLFSLANGKHSGNLVTE